MKILLFAGAGTSVELGVPSMTGLALEFLQYSQQWKIEPDLVQKILDSQLDVEHLIEELDAICAAGPSLMSIGYKTPGWEKAKKVRAEVEWFVQHFAERVTAIDAQIMWGSILNATKRTEITFVTTNYDRAIELAANAVGISFNDGFGAFTEEEAVRWTGFEDEKQCPILIKLHGSTDWFADKNNKDHPMKLRHPMPLFGHSTLLFDDLKLDSSLVLPSREKRLTGVPYPRLSQMFLNSIDCCDLALFIGSSLRDKHIRDAALSITENIPVFIVNPDGNNHGIDGGYIISQHASTFLVSTLPNILLAPDPKAGLLEACDQTNTLEHGILSAVKDLLDSNVDASRRRLASDELFEAGATLAPDLISKVLNDSDPTLARYTLGLIPTSTARESLIEMAAKCPYKDDPAFREELDILGKLEFTGI